MQTRKILHIIQGLYRGGSGRALTATAKYSAKLDGFRHRVISLQSAAPGAIEMAQEAGISVLDAPDRSTLIGEMERADIVHLHFWNHPQMYDFLRSELPAMRLLMWFHIAGDKPPQVLTRELVDYADFAVKVAERVNEGDDEMGILICGSGQGVCMTANKFPKVRAGLVYNRNSAEMTRLHNNANVLCLPGRELNEAQIREILEVWLNTEFEGGRHERRINKIESLTQQK